MNVIPTQCTNLQNTQLFKNNVKKIKEKFGRELVNSVMLCGENATLHYIGGNSTLNKLCMSQSAGHIKCSAVATGKSTNPNHKQVSFH